MPTDALVKDVYSINPQTFRHWLHVEEAIMRGPSAFPAGERELIAAYVSRLNSCTYCASSHSEAAVILGVDPLSLNIPLRLENPKIGRVDDAEIVGDRIAEDGPVFRHLHAQEMQNGSAEVVVARVASVVGHVAMHQSP